MELLRNAMTGWNDMNTNGKYTLLLLGALLWLWYWTRMTMQGRKGNGIRVSAGREGSAKELGSAAKESGGRESGAREPGSRAGFGGERGKWLLCYGMLLTVLATCPVTAVALMIYQTKFYDYVWLWSLVPVSLMIGWAAVTLWNEFYEKRWKGQLLRPACCAVFGLALLVLCGNLGGFSPDWEQQAQDRSNTEKMLDYLTESGKNSNICLWAPSELTAHVRALNGEVQLLYGRNMWEEALNGYSYDVYDAEIVRLYEWMESLSSAGDLTGHQADSGKAAGLGACSSCVETALLYGVNTIVVPADIPEEFSTEILRSMQDSGRQVSEAGTVCGDYLIYRIEG